jgi:hypothetical protein
MSFASMGEWMEEVDRTNILIRQLHAWAAPLFIPGRQGVAREGLAL